MYCIDPAFMGIAMHVQAAAAAVQRTAAAEVDSKNSRLDRALMRLDRALDPKRCPPHKDSTSCAWLPLHWASPHEQLLFIPPAMRTAWWCGYMPELMLDAMCWMLQQCSGAPAPAREACGNMPGSAAAPAAAEPASSK